MKPYKYIEGGSPLLISIPHSGVALPDDVASRMTAAGLELPDTDWHLEQLYDVASSLGASVISAEYSRYVIDLNRDPENKPLYPGADNTELCPTTRFDHAPIYREGQAPDAEEIERRRRTYWVPYHEQLRSTLERLRAAHGAALLFDAHSIRSEVPRFFTGQLPDLNIGTASGQSCAPSLLRGVEAVLRAQSKLSWVCNARFKGGHITRAYGCPLENIQAIQLEIAQKTYMNEAPPFEYLPERAALLKPLLRHLLSAMLAWATQGRA